MTTADPDCRFCAIVAGDESSHVVYQDETSLAFLDHRPLFPGHCLLVPREHIETLVTFEREGSSRTSTSGGAAAGARDPRRDGQARQLRR